MAATQPAEDIDLTARTTAGIVALGSYVPDNEVPLTMFGDGEPPSAEGAALLRPPAHRHHVRPGERAAEMVERAARPLFERLEADPPAVDMILTNTLLPDTPITGCGAEVAQRLELDTDLILDVHNGGCGSFPYMLRLAEALMRGTGARTALLCNVQNTAGQLFAQPETRRSPSSAVAGDGCGVTYLVAGGGSPLLDVVVRNEPRFAADMGLRLDDGRRYWEPGTSEMSVSFDAAKKKEIVQRGNEIVPSVVAELCERLGVATSEIDVLITNQPNRLFLRKWQRALDLPEERHLDTFDLFGNLYGAGTPVTLDWAVREGRLKDGDLVVVAGFAHAGDFASAAALRWQSG
jgi:3-oxoacyl-[acyl-carrier-protein] synthase-3